MRSCRLLVLLLTAILLVMAGSDVSFSDSSRQQRAISKIRELKEEKSKPKPQKKPKKAAPKKRKTAPKPKPKPNKTVTAPSTGWHPQATCRVTAFTYNVGDSAVKLSVQYRNGATDEIPVPFDTNGEDKFFKIFSLPAGLQVILPQGWTVNVDSREGFVAKIMNPNNIASSSLNYESNYDDWGGKTFTSGEAFIIAIQSGMTIRPQSYTAPTR